MESVFDFVGVLCLVFSLQFDMNETSTEEDDPCQHYTVMDDEWRHVSNKVVTSHCDTVLSEGWYRMYHQGRPAAIPNVCIKGPSCGQRVPLHVEFSNGLPRANETIEADLCGSHQILDKWDCCVLRKKIPVKNCGRYFVYKLVPVDRCSVGYCVIHSNDEVEPYTAKTGETISPSDRMMHDCYPFSSNSPDHIPHDNLNQLGHPINIRDTTSVLQDQCGEGYLPCTDNKACYPNTTRCDNDFNCVDLSDEMDCPEVHPCPEGTFRCANGKCIIQGRENCTQDNVEESTPVDLDQSTTVPKQPQQQRKLTYRFTVPGNDQFTQPTTAASPENLLRSHENGTVSIDTDVEVPNSLIDSSVTISTYLFTSSSVPQIAQSDLFNSVNTSQYVSHDTQKSNFLKDMSTYLQSVFTMPLAHISVTTSSAFSSDIDQLPITNVFSSSVTSLISSSPSIALSPWVSSSRRIKMKQSESLHNSSSPFSRYTVSTIFSSEVFNSTQPLETGVSSSKRESNNVNTNLVYSSFFVEPFKADASSSFGIFSSKTYSVKPTSVLQDISVSFASSSQDRKSVYSSSPIQTSTGILETPIFRQVLSNSFSDLSSYYSSNFLTSYSIYSSSLSLPLASSFSVSSAPISIMESISLSTRSSKTMSSLDLGLIVNYSSSVVHNTTMPGIIKRDADIFMDNADIFIVIIMTIIVVVLPALIICFCIKQRARTRSWTCRQEQYYVKCEKDLLMKPKSRQSIFIENPIQDNEMLYAEQQMTENSSLHLSLDPIDISSFKTASLPEYEDGYVVPISELEDNCNQEKTKDTTF